MAGIIGCVGALEPEKARAVFQGSAEALCSGKQFRAQIVHDSRGVLLGVVRRPEPPVSEWQSPDGEWMVLLYGRSLVRAPDWQPTDAEEIGRLYGEGGLEALFELDGSFVLVVLDRRKNVLRVLRDRTGSIPLLYARGDRGIAFAPEAKALFPLVGLRPRLDRPAVLSFLNLGYPIADQTMFEGVHQLVPGHVLEIGLDGSRMKAWQYWDLSFDPEPRMTLPEAVDSLETALRESHRAAVSDDPRETQILLTGGFDSRALLGFLASAGKPPDRALTWGISEDIPDSDTQVARTVAEAVSVPHQFLYYGPERLVENASRWALLGELSSDNLGDYAAGPQFFEQHGIDPDVPLFIGDQMLGPGGFPRTMAQAVNNITNLSWESLRPELAGMMSRQQHAESERLLWKALRAVMAGCQSEHPKDMQDYLFFHVYVVRWLYAPAYFREPVVAPRRPFMLQSTIEFGRKLPRQFRVDKRILVELMKRRLPRLAEIPIASANSLVDWEYELRANDSVREFLLELLEWSSVANTPLGTLLDRQAFEQTVSRYFSAVPQPMCRTPSSLPAAMRWRRKLAAVPIAGAALRAVEPLAKRLLGGEPPDQTGRVLRGIALVSLLGDLIDRGSFDHVGAVHG